MLYNLYFSNGQPPAKVVADDVGEWVYTDVELDEVRALGARQCFVNQHGDRWERIR